MGRLKKIKKARAEARKKEAIEPLQTLSRKDYLTATILSAATLVVYAFTAAPGLTLADSGDFLNGVLTLGIVHPPGYPLYTVLGHLFTYLPFGGAAFRVNLFSALWGSFCLAIMFLILRILSIERHHAVFAASALGFTTIFWSKTGVAEVYSFNAFLIACIVFSILSYNRDKKRPQLYLIFLMTGLALANHYPLVILSGVGLVFLLDRHDLHTEDVFKGLIFFGLGLTPYLYLLIQASNPEVHYNFGKLSDVRMVLDHISRKYYDIDYGGTLPDKFLLGSTFLKAVLTNFLFSTPFLLFGLCSTFLQKHKYRYPLILATLSPSVGLIVLLTFPSHDMAKALFLAYLIPTFLFLSVFLAIGVAQLMNRYVKHKVLRACLLFILFVTQVGFNFSGSTHHDDQLAEIWGTELLNSLKPNSILVLCGQGYFHIYHLHLIQGVREDVTIYDRFSFYTKDNLYEPSLVFKRKDVDEYRKTRERELVNNSLRPIYYTCNDVLEAQNMKYSVTPFVFRADKGHFEASDPTPFRVSEELLQSVVSDYPESEYWLDRARKGIFSRLISYYGGHQLAEVDRIVNYLMETRFYSNPRFILRVANNLYYFKNYGLARKFYERAEELSLESFRPTDLAVFCHTLTEMMDYDKALAICTRQERSSAPCEVNTVKTRQTIASIYHRQRNWLKVAEYAGKILRCHPNHEIAQTYLELATERSE